ncbi:DUF177 domain-containing protein [Pararhizobium sp. IMCC21322]|uniref:YceD family protein n=1 Tax=Pararhizobium sp. IMCC21322 TaxID=3067903 RepID=UPI00274115F0|nr:DUF177 domain-containing protein [Pararhizobium sp. IMCC21322]
MSKLKTASENDANLHDRFQNSMAGLWPWKYPIVAGDITNDAKDFIIKPDKADHAAIADALNVLAVHDLNATLRLHRTKNSIRVRGHVDAVVEQSCVVTLEPVRQSLMEEVDRTFVANRSDFDTVFAKMSANRATMIDPDEVDPPEIVENGRLDLAAIALEHVIIGIDLYPRAPGADLSEVDAPKQVQIDVEERESPFAALAKLKTAGNG